MAVTSNKVLYIDNVSTYNYVKSHRIHNEVRDPSESRFTYVVFTNYERPNNYGVSYHGDIFFNGSKITYVNDVDVTKAVTDGMDTIIGYVNDAHGVDFARSTILIDGLSNKYEKFNVVIPNGEELEISYERISNIGHYTIEEEGNWSSSVSGASANNVTVENGKIKCGQLNGSLNVQLKYTFKINDSEHSRICNDYAYFIIHNLSDVKSIDFGNTPSTLPYKSIYTPLMNIEPKEAKQTMLTFTSTNTDVIDILNSRTGTFRCKKPGSSTIKCAYNGSSTSMLINVGKVNPQISLTSFNTTWLYNTSPYNKTTCYAHYDTQELPGVTAAWTLEKFNTSTNQTTSSDLGTNAIKSNNINYDDLNDNSNIINRVRFTLNPASNFINNMNSTVMQLYAPGQQPSATEGITIDNYEVDSQNNTISFVIAATGSGNFVDTNYSLDGSLGIGNFVVTDIVTIGNVTYTHVTAALEANYLNDMYAAQVAANNQAAGTENEVITCYNVIRVHTTDSSFVETSYNAAYDIDVREFESTVSEMGEQAGH